MEEKWEYMTQFVKANVETHDVKEYLLKNWPNFKPEKFSPEAMIPILNSYGDKGWELVHMEPIAGVGKNSDVLHTGTYNSYSNIYFCVFKRRTIKSE